MAAYAGEHDSLVLLVMCGEPGPWVRDELIREFSEPLEAKDALTRLRQRGLVIEMDGGLLMTTAAGRYANAMAGGRG